MERLNIPLCLWNVTRSETLFQVGEVMAGPPLTHEKLIEISTLVEDLRNLSRERNALAAGGKLKIELRLEEWDAPDLGACNGIAERPEVQSAIRNAILGELDREIADLGQDLRELGFDVSSIDNEC